MPIKIDLYMPDIYTNVCNDVAFFAFKYLFDVFLLWTDMAMMTDSRHTIFVKIILHRLRLACFSMISHPTWINVTTVIPIL